MGALTGQVAVVAGATRGAGRGIACALGEAGATVYCTGRTVRGRPSTFGRQETVEETAELVDAAGGTGIAVRVDHTEPDRVRELFDRVDSEQGRLDVLVNDLSGNDQLDFGMFSDRARRPFWENDPGTDLKALDVGIGAHFTTSHFAARLMIRRHRGLIVEIGDGNFVGYNNAGVAYSLMRTSEVVLAHLMAEELRPYQVAAVSLTPGFLRSEQMLEAFSVSEDNWRDAVTPGSDFGNSESPLYVGRAVVALAGDPHVMARTGHALSAGYLAREYGFTDADGSQPPGYRAESRFEEGLFAFYNGESG
ncbi:SDR family oxidoreductase [Microlunatus sp. GCM10028923]|uniref:SDR family oxidoreductase n=1 Tax=Microlunatus sp. GCM10028923 TaxID=3273400 RepID=UPI00361E1784